MNLDYRHLLPEHFAPASRVWIYQASRRFGMSEALQIEEILEAFVNTWKTHGTPVNGYGNLFFGQFIVLMADESQAGVSGCSTDSSVHVIKEIERAFKVNMFDRQQLAFYIKESIQLLPMPQLAYAVDNHFINGDTIYFNNTVLTKEALETQWLLPVKESWLAKRIKLPAVY
jgi:hypothetical protein